MDCVKEEDEDEEEEEVGDEGGGEEVFVEGEEEPFRDELFLDRGLRVCDRRDGEGER